MSNIVAKRVARGVAYLDSNKSGWRDLIDVESLDMADGWSCILGQLARHHFNDESLDEDDEDCDTRAFEAGRGLLGMDAVEAINHGFDLSYQDYGTPATFEALQAEWERVLTAQ